MEGATVLCLYSDLGSASPNQGSDIKEREFPKVILIDKVMGSLHGIWATGHLKCEVLAVFSSYNHPPIDHHTYLELRIITAPVAPPGYPRIANRQVKVEATCRKTSGNVCSFLEPLSPVQASGGQKEKREKARAFPKQINTPMI